MPLTTNKVLPMTQLTTGAEDVPLRVRYELAASFLTRTSAADLFADVISSLSSRERALSLVAGIDHVGFVVDPRDAASIGAAASSAGFDQPPRAFPSAIIARELGEKLGRPMVPTTIVQTCGRSHAGSQLMVEAVVPHGAGGEVVRHWIRENVAAHVAFRVNLPSDLIEIGTIMGDEGFHAPAFMGNGAMTNPAGRITIAYFDAVHEGRTLRLEFCHYGLRA